jgi:hypothetical protein
LIFLYIVQGRENEQKGALGQEERGECEAIIILGIGLTLITIKSFLQSAGKDSGKRDPYILLVGM